MQTAQFKSADPGAVAADLETGIKEKIVSKQFLGLQMAMAGHQSPMKAKAALSPISEGVSPILGAESPAINSVPSDSTSGTPGDISCMSPREGSDTASANGVPASNQERRPGLKLKAMQWKKLAAREIPGTIWEGLDDYKYKDQIQYDEIDRLFVAARQQTSPAIKSIVADSGSNNSEQEADDVASVTLRKLLAVEEKMMISIVLNKVPHGVCQLAEGLQRMDTSVFGPALSLKLMRVFNSEKIPKHVATLLSSLKDRIDSFPDKCDKLLIMVGLAARNHSTWDLLQFSKALYQNDPCNTNRLYVRTQIGRPYQEAISREKENMRFPLNDR
jgi:hypothetical protein